MTGEKALPFPEGASQLVKVGTAFFLFMTGEKAPPFPEGASQLVKVGTAFFLFRRSSYLCASFYFQKVNL